MVRKRGANGSRDARRDPRRRVARLDDNRAFLRALADALRDILAHERRTAA
jgi:hypothetical protein